MNKSKTTAKADTSQQIEAERKRVEATLSDRIAAAVAAQQAEAKLEAEQGKLVLAEADGDEKAAARMKDIESEQITAVLRTRKAELLVRQTQKRIAELTARATAARQQEAVKLRNAAVDELVALGPDIDAAITRVVELAVKARTKGVEAYTHDNATGKEPNSRLYESGNFLVWTLLRRLAGFSNSIPYAPPTLWGDDLRNATYTDLINALARGAKAAGPRLVLPEEETQDVAAVA